MAQARRQENKHPDADAMTIESKTVKTRKIKSVLFQEELTVVGEDDDQVVLAVPVAIERGDEIRCRLYKVATAALIKR